MYGEMAAFVPLPPPHVATKICRRLRLRLRLRRHLRRRKVHERVMVHLKIWNKFQCLILIWYRITVISIRAYEGGCC